MEWEKGGKLAYQRCLCQASSHCVLNIRVSYLHATSSISASALVKMTCQISFALYIFVFSHLSLRENVAVDYSTMNFPFLLFIIREK